MLSGLGSDWACGTWSNPGAGKGGTWCGFQRARQSLAGAHARRIVAWRHESSLSQCLRGELSDSDGSHPAALLPGKLCDL